MIIQITPDGFIHLSGDAPEVGRKYLLEDATEGTQAQNRAFHALVQEYFTSGCHSYNAKTWLELREYIKRDLGAGFESFVVATPDGIKKAATKAEAVEILKAFGIDEVNRYALGKLKSWADYTKKERKKTLDRLISEMIQAGVQTKHFFEILEGMNDQTA